MRRNPPAFLSKCVTQFGPVTRFPIPRNEVWLLADVNDTDRVLRSQHRSFSKATIQYRTLSSVTGEGLLTSDADVWRSMRRLLSPAFHAQLLDRVTSESELAASHFAETATHDSTIDVDAAMLDVSLQVVARSLLGVNISAAARSLIDAVMTALQIVVAKAQQPPIPFIEQVTSSRERRLADALAVIDTVVGELIARREADGLGDDALSLLVRARNEGAITTAQVRDEVVTLIVAGHETVAATLTWCWLLLASRPEVEQAVQREADSLQNAATSSVDALTRLPVTRAVVEECLRLYPPAWVITRRSLTEQSFGGYAMPAGATVILSPFLLHRDPAHWSDPLRFDPQRFLSGNGRPGRAYLPFGAGPRLCIGRDLALTEAPLVLAAVARRLRLRPLRPSHVTPEFGVTLRPEGGLPVRVSRRRLSAPA